MGPPPYQGDWGKKIVTERRYLARFGGEIHASRTGAFGLVVRNLLFSREYTLADRANYFRGTFSSGTLSNRSTWLSSGHSSRMEPRIPRK